MVPRDLVFVSPRLLLTVPFVLVTPVDLLRTLEVVPSLLLVMPERVRTVDLLPLLTRSAPILLRPNLRSDFTDLTVPANPPLK